MVHRLRRGLLLLAGTFILLAGATSAFITVPHLREDLLEIHVRSSLLSATVLGLHFGTFAMFGTGVLVLAIALGSASYGSVRAPLLAIAITYVAFGVFAFVWSHSKHTLGYVVMSLLAGVSALFREPRTTPSAGGGASSLSGLRRTER